MELFHVAHCARGRSRLLLVLGACLFSVSCSDNSRTARLDTENEAGVGGKSPIVHRRPKLPPPVSSVAPRFADVARDSGIDFTFFADVVPGRFFLPEVMGGGVAWMDYDSDGLLDLYVRDGCSLEPPDSAPEGHFSRLFRNIGGGRFLDVTLSSQSDFRGYGQGCAVGDYDVDGFADLYLTNYGPNALLHNNGDGTFTDVTQMAGVGDARWASSAAWFDVDGDRNPDLYVANYMNVTKDNHKICKYDGKPGYCGPGSYNSAPDVVYLGRGDGTFVEAAESLGFHDGSGKGLAVVVADFDDDLLPEVFVANDMTPNQLFSRSVALDSSGERRAPYSDVAQAAGCAVSDAGLNEAGMGIACADFDGDGRPDLFVTHYYHMKNTLYRNRGQLVFDDDSRRTRIAAASFESLGFGTWAFDYDRDGDPDLFIANGHVLGSQHQPNAMRPQLLLNTQGVFSDISDDAGDYFRELCLGRGVGAGDFDNDGDIDLAVTHLGRPLALLRNDTETRRRFIGIQLDTPSRIPPVGGRIVVTCGRLRQVLPVISGGSYLSASDTRLLAGLGDEQSAVTVEIFWPSGRADRFESLEPDRYWKIVEGRQPVTLNSP